MPGKMKPTPRPGSGFCDPQVPPPPMPSERPTPSEELEIRICFMGHEFGEIEAVPLFRYRALQRELADVTNQRDTLADALKYIAHSGLSARHLVDYALIVLKESLK
jgi:hypothetical protein